jgi:hypothetical protein
MNTIFYRTRNGRGSNCFTLIGSRMFRFDINRGENNEVSLDTDFGRTMYRIVTEKGLDLNELSARNR